MPNQKPKKEKKQKTIFEREMDYVKMEQWAMTGILGIAIAIAAAFVLLEQVPQIIAPSPTPTPAPFPEMPSYEATASPTASPIPMSTVPPLPAGTAISACGEIQHGGTAAVHAKYYLSADLAFSSAGGKTECIAIDADYVELDCAKHVLVGTGPGAGAYTPQGTGIYLRQGSHVTVKNCVAKNFANGLLVESSGNVVVDSEFDSNTYGVWVSGIKNSFGNVRAKNNKDAGLYLDSGTTINTFTNCDFSDNKQGMFTTAGSTQVNSFKGTRLCENQNDLNCQMGNIDDLGGNSCAGKGSCSIKCGSC